jgi:hypothetical protein
MACSFTASNESPFKTDNQIEVLRKEIQDYQKCILGNHDRMVALTHIFGASGHTLDPESCSEVPRDLVKTIMRDLVSRLLAGMEVKGGYGNWSCGGFGSRWIDLDAKDYGLDHIRCAFYSKKHYQGVWKHDKPYVIDVVVEKARR